jgi:hexosaminidase
VLEPVKGYERHRNHYGASSSFNRLVDAIPPESNAARNFRDLVDQYLGAPAPALADRIRKQLEKWSANAIELRPLLETNSLLVEDVPLADALQSICKTGQEALGYSAAKAPEGWKQKASAILKDANQHHGAILIAIEPAIQKLVDAAQ